MLLPIDPSKGHLQLMSVTSLAFISVVNLLTVALWLLNGQRFVSSFNFSAIQTYYLIMSTCKY
ncbi:MAG: hypothetical protein ACI80L_000075 [Pseudohongiellaceae bacterium]|jgi:hypothetical protein